MNSADLSGQHERWLLNRLREKIAKSLGVSKGRRSEIYIELAQSSSLLDISYWLLVFFAAGIASLGLVLNSPAVIIGAMLISPLMGPILASGLTLATGDLILGLRASIKIGFSCLIAIGFAMILVALLPFKEITPEIAARTRPNTLDLVIALLSGAIGSISICRDVKGVATSIPGVAIAVALMPPLCVVGYGLGVALTLNPTTGLQVAQGGGLLFMTNLIAITFTAMVVFLILHIDTDEAKSKLKGWRDEDKESIWLTRVLNNFPVIERFRSIGSLPGRLLTILILIVLISIPLTQSFSQLRAEIAKKQRENQIVETARSIWNQLVAKLPDGRPRSSIDRLTTFEQDDKLVLQMSVFTSKPLDIPEREEFTHMVATKLDRPFDSVTLQLVEIPTATSELLQRPIQAPVEVGEATVGKMEADFRASADSIITSLELPNPARSLGYEMTMRSQAPMAVRIYYLSDREISEDARELLEQSLKTKLGMSSVTLALERVPSVVGPLAYQRNRHEITQEIRSEIDRIGYSMLNHPNMNLTIETTKVEGEKDGVSEERSQEIVEYLASQWNIQPDRMMMISNAGDRPIVTLRLDQASAR